MKIILTTKQLKSILNEQRPVRYFEGEDYDIPEQIDWLVRQKEFLYIQGDNSSHVLKLINNIIHNLQKVQGGTSSL